MPFLSPSTCRATESFNQGENVLFQTLATTRYVSPVNISGTISHLTGLFGTRGSTGPHGGESKSALFCMVIVQSVPSEDRNGVKAPPAIPASPEGVPSQRRGYGFPRLASEYSSPALAREGAWNSARHAPKEEPVNCVESQKYTGLKEAANSSASMYILCMARM